MDKLLENVFQKFTIILPSLRDLDQVLPPFHPKIAPFITPHTLIFLYTSCTLFLPSKFAWTFAHTWPNSGLSFAPPKFFYSTSATFSPPSVNVTRAYRTRHNRPLLQHRPIIFNHQDSRLSHAMYISFLLANHNIKQIPFLEILHEKILRINNSFAVVSC